MKAYRMTEQDEKAIRALVQQMMDGWNAHDGDAFAVPFAEDADYVVVNGAYVRGREAIAAGHVRIFTTIYHDSYNEITVERIRLLREDVAVVHAHAHLTIRANDAVEETNARLGIVAVKDDDRWEIAAFQNTRIQDPRS